jgi:hypothetical protein
VSEGWYDLDVVRCAECGQGFERGYGHHCPMDWMPPPEMYEAEAKKKIEGISPSPVRTPA